MVALALTVACPSSAFAQSKRDAVVGPIQQQRLANGMTVIVQEDHRIPSVTLRLRYEGGQAGAPQGLEWAAPLTTALMLEETKHVHSGEYQRLLSRAGALPPGSYPSETSISLEVTLPSNQLALPLWLWSDQMAFFREGLDDARLAAKRDQLREERRLALAGSPAARVDLFADEELFPPSHPYHRIWLDTQDIGHVDKAAVLAFHERWINPPHATLVVVGDVTYAKAMSVVEKYFGSIPRGNAEHAGRPASPTLSGDVHLEVAANTSHAQVSIRWVTPRWLTMEDGRLDVLAQCLAGRRTAWLYWKLVDRAKVATRVRAHEESLDWASVFEIFLEGAPGRSPAEILSAFDTAMDEIRAQTMSDNAIDGSAYDYLIDRVLAFEQAPFRASRLAGYTATVGDPGYYKHDFERYEGITPEILKETLDTWLPRDRRVVLLIAPTPGASAGGEIISRTVIPASAP
jgi:zinc protease